MINRMVSVYAQEYAQPEEGHGLRNEATKAFEGVRSQVASLINAEEPCPIIFYRVATEGSNLVARALQRGQQIKAGDEMLITKAEHYSNLVP